MKNEGKNFESVVKNSIPDYVMLTRIPDPPQSFTQRNDTAFSRKNPYDFEAFDTVHRIQYCWELKTTAQKYLTYHVSEDDEKKKKSANIQWHQIEGLTRASEYNNIISGFLFNFRLENNEQLLYFLNIKDFNKFRKNTNKKSLNIMDISLNGGIKIKGEKLKKNYRWDIDGFLKSQSKIYPI